MLPMHTTTTKKPQQNPKLVTNFAAREVIALAADLLFLCAVAIAVAVAALLLDSTKRFCDIGANSDGPNIWETCEISREGFKRV